MLQSALVPYLTEFFESVNVMKLAKHHDGKSHDDDDVRLIIDGVPICISRDLSLVQIIRKCDSEAESSDIQAASCEEHSSRVLDEVIMRVSNLRDSILGIAGMEVDDPPGEEISAEVDSRTAATAEGRNDSNP